MLTAKAPWPVFEQQSNQVTKESEAFVPLPAAPTCLAEI